MSDHLKLRQASGVAIDGRAVLLEGPSGCGKSTLALMLLDRGATLIGDDGVALEMRGEALWAHPPPNITGLLEVRGVGLLEFPVTSAPVALVLDLAGEMPRYVEEAEPIEVEGANIPRLAFDPAGPAGAIRAEQALVRHGLPREGTT
jgi:serine kinase of HPr protein (carbohydrate metabolism regulator)